MRTLVQRVTSAQVTIDGETVGEIGRGLLVLAGFESDDGQDDLQWMARKLVRLRIFPDERDMMNRSVVEAGGDILAVPQFTLYAAVRKGNRPSWGRAAPGDISAPLFSQFVEQLASALGRPVPSGVFAADMQVALVNDGPITLFIDSRNPE